MMVSKNPERQKEHGLEPDADQDQGMTAREDCQGTISID